LARGTRERLALASDFGADLAVDVAVEDPVAALRHAAGRWPMSSSTSRQGARRVRRRRSTSSRPQAPSSSHGRGLGSRRAWVLSDMVVMKEIRILGALGVDTTA